MLWKERVTMGNWSLNGVHGCIDLVAAEAIYQGNFYSRSFKEDQKIKKWDSSRCYAIGWIEKEKQICTVC